jgi:hypothetical protein
MLRTRFNSLSQLAAVMAGFAATILLLESGALLTWAERLEVGPARNGAVRMTAALHKALAPLGVEQVRKASLDGLDRLGWTDDPARLLAAREKFAPGGAGSASPCVAAARVPNAGAPKIDVPLVASVPRLTPLAPLPPAAAGQPRVVALVGDSMMAVGLSDVLLRQTAENPNLRVVKAFRSGTGLARPDVFDWMQEYPAMIGNEKPDAIIVAIGANDGQGFVEDGKTLAYGSDAWVKVYQQRTTNFLDMLTQSGAHVIWVGLPPMKSGAYNERAAEINRIAYTVVSQNPLATWWNPQSLIADVADNFRELETAADGKTTRIRAADGIHLSDEGAALLTPALIGWLNAAPTPPASAQEARLETPPSITAVQGTKPESLEPGSSRHRRWAHRRAARH